MADSKDYWKTIFQLLQSQVNCKGLSRNFNHTNNKKEELTKVDKFKHKKAKASILTGREILQKREELEQEDQGGKGTAEI